jgi:hypothetical protein
VATKSDRAREWEPVYSIAPRTKAPVVREFVDDEGEVQRSLELARWGCTPRGRRTRVSARSTCARRRSRPTACSSAVLERPRRRARNRLLRVGRDRRRRQGLLPHPPPRRAAAARRRPHRRTQGRRRRRLGRHLRSRVTSALMQIVRHRVDDQRQLRDVGLIPTTAITSPSRTALAAPRAAPLRRSDRAVIGPPALSASGRHTPSEDSHGRVA